MDTQIELRPPSGFASLRKARRLARPWVSCAVIGVILTAVLSACTVGPDFRRPAVAKQAGYMSDNVPLQTAAADVPGGAAQHFVTAQDIPGQWWALFRSPALNALIDEALRANPDLAAAQAALREAREILFADQGTFFPTINGSVSDTREKLSGAFFGRPNFSPTLTISSASLSVSYLPDVFGGVRRQVESAAAQAEYERFELEATYLTLTANVVNTAVTLASLHDQITATQDIVKIETDQLDVVKHQFDLGAVSRSDVLTQEATLAQAAATLPPLQKQLAQARNQLTAYIGRFPNRDQGESFDLASFDLPRELPVSLPSRLVDQRPDVRAAEAQLHEAGANIGVAIADQLPQFSITGQIGSTATAFDNLFAPGTGVWSIGGSLAQTIFDAAAQEHRKRAAVAAYDVAAAQYRKAVLSAFQDVANALRALEADADSLQADVTAERSARDSLDLARQQYQIGTLNYLALLTAEQTYENAVLNRVRAQAARYSDTAALFQALGGGWWNRTDVAAMSEGRADRFALPPVQDIHLPLTGAHPMDEAKSTGQARE